MTDDETGPVSVHIDLTMDPDNDGERTLTSAYLGMDPYILIEPTLTEDRSGVVWKVHTGGGIPQDTPDLIEALEALCVGLREAVAARPDA